MDLARLREKKESTDDADNNLDGRGVTNNDDTANIRGYASKYEDRFTGNLPVTRVT